MSFILPHVELIYILPHVVWSFILSHVVFRFILPQVVLSFIPRAQTKSVNNKTDDKHQQLILNLIIKDWCLFTL